MPGLSAYAADQAVFKAPTVVHADGTAIWARGFGGNRVQQADGVLLRTSSTFYGGAIAVTQSLQRVQSTVNVAASSGTTVSDLLNQLKSAALSASDTSTNTAQRAVALLKAEGFVVIQDSWITDLRRWKPGGTARNDPNSYAYHSRRLMVAKTADNTENGVFRWRLLPRLGGRSWLSKFADVFTV